MIEIDATLIKDARDVVAYLKQVKSNVEQIQKNIKYADFKTLQIEEALADIVYKAQEIITELE